MNLQTKIIIHKITKGKKIDGLTILDPWYKKSGHDWIVKCLCDCGNLYFPTRGNLRTRTTNINCGCAPSKHVRLEQANLNIAVSAYMDSARRRDIKWKLTHDQTIMLMKSNCYYCGCVPQRKLFRADRRSSKVWFVNGIDRLNNNLGYTITNSVPCCKFCNMAKSTLTSTRFINKVKDIYEHLTLQNEYNIVNMARNNRTEILI